MEQNQTNQACVPASPAQSKGKTRAARAAVVGTTLLLVALIAVNLLFGLLPSSWRVLDMTDNDLYTISPVSKKMLALLDEDVTIYVLSSGSRLGLVPQTLIDRYTSQSKHVCLEIIDPTDEEQLSRVTAHAAINTLTEESVIVASARRHVVFDYSDCKYYYVQGMGAMSAQQYQAYYMQYYLYLDQLKEAYGVDLANPIDCFALESTLTQAIEYVSAPVIPTVYVLRGHGERAIDASFDVMCQPMLIETVDLELSSVGEIPDNAAALMICAPTSDLTESETEQILAYVQNGGHVLLISAPENAAMPNLMRVAAAYGARPVQGVLHEGNANNFKDLSHKIIPTVSQQHTVTANLAANGYRAVIPNAHGMTLDEVMPEGMRGTVLFSTSEVAYTEDESGQTSDVGVSALAVAVENEQTGAMLAWFGSYDAFTTESFNTYGPNANYYLAMAASWVNVDYTSALDAIEPTVMNESAVQVPAIHALVIGAATVIVLPLGLIVAGVVVRVRRGRR